MFTTSLSFEGASEIRIQQTLRTKKAVFVGPAAGSSLNADDIQFFVEGADDGSTPRTAKFGQNNTVTAHLNVPNGTIWLKKGTVASGAFFGKNVIVGQNTDVSEETGAVTPEVAAPIITPNGGSFSGSVSVNLSTITTGASIFYTLDGTTPTSSSTLFTGPFNLTANATVNVIAVRNGFIDSAVTTADFAVQPLPQVAPVTFNPAPGTFQASVDVSLSTTTAGTTIHFTLDGTTPTTASPIFTTAITLTETTTVKAIGVKAGFIDSIVTSAVYDVQPLPPVPPILQITSPQEGGFVIQSRPVISLTYSDDQGVDTASLALTVNGQPLVVDCQLDLVFGSCTPTEDLPEGNVTLAASISDLEGAIGSSEVSFFVDSIPVEVAILSPGTQTITRDAQVIVTGAVGPNLVSLEVNGVTATLNGVNFTATVPLREGKNAVIAIGKNANGKPGVDTVEVTRDIQNPIVRIDSPRNNFPAVENKVTVTGVVNDIVDGGVAAMVKVNGIEVPVVNGTFIAVNLELGLGPNTIEAVAIDAVGNQGNHSINVNFSIPAGPRILLTSGMGQKALVGQALSEPLVVQVVDGEGLPVAGRLVRFEVTRNNGVLTESGNPTPDRIIAVPTDGNGRAQVDLILGTTAGSGNNRVRATSVGVAGEVEFCATGFPDVPDKIIALMGGNQRGPIGEPLPTPLETLVVDAEGNPVEGVDVVFTTVEGSGNFNGSNSTIVVTGADGIARAVFSLGFEAGINNNSASAEFTGLTGLPSIFTNSGLIAGDPANTKFSGVVLDNAQTPIPNATVTIEGTAVTGTTNGEGQFELTSVPVGPITLHIDPSTTTRPETFPPLEFETVTVAGNDNILGQPIQLPLVDTGNSQIVGVGEDVTLTMKDVSGVELKVFANSVTFPDGSNTGFLSISQVHLDKVPMPPANGSIPSVVWTIQPAGVIFDPPAQVTLPNSAGLPPGSLVEAFQFDHDLFIFTSVGQATVTQDGLSVVSDPGFGITRSGWGCVHRPPPSKSCTSGSTGAAPVCNVLNAAQCRWDAKPQGSTCNDGNTCTLPGECDGQGSCSAGQSDISKNGTECSDESSCTFNGVCNNGACDEGEQFSIGSVEMFLAPDKGEGGTYQPKEEIRFDAFATNIQCDDFSSVDDLKFLWSFGDGEVSFESSPKHKYEKPGEYTVAVLVTCGSCEEVLASASQIIKVEQTRFEIIVEAFIPFNYAAPTIPSFDIKSPPLIPGYLGFVSFQGDGLGRPFSPTQGKFRVRGRVIVDPEDANPIQSSFLQVGESVAYTLDSEGNEDQRYRVSTQAERDELISGFVVTSEPLPGGGDGVRINLEGNFPNPITFIEPNINFDYQVDIELPTNPDDLASYIISGENDKYPSHAIYINKKRVHKFSPVSNDATLLFSTINVPAGTQGEITGSFP